MTDEERIVEAVARALWEADHDRTAWEDATEDGPDEYRRRARAAVAAYRATDGGAEAAVRRVEALLDDAEARNDRRSFRFFDGSKPPAEIDVSTVRAALAPQAGDGAR